MNTSRRTAIRALWTSLLLWFVHVPTSAQQYGVLTYAVNSDDTVTITGCPENTIGAITIPAQIDGRRVTAVRGFISRRGLTSISIPEGVTTIDSFAYCIALTSISIPASVTSIGESPTGDFAFDHCPSLTAIDVSPQNPNYSSLDGVLFDKNRTTLLQCPGGKTGAFAIPGTVTSVRIFAFRECGRLTSVSIPGSVTSIGPGAFTDCASLTSVSIAANVTSIAGLTFWRCTSLLSISIPAGVTAIQNSAFSACTSLTSVSIPASVTTIDATAFSRCLSLSVIEVDPLNPNFTIVDGVLMDKTLTRLILFPAARAGAWSIPASISEIPMEAFRDCTGLTSVFIPTTITSIPHSAFQGCTSLSSIVIPEGVTSIGNSAFANCTSLASVAIPDTVTVMWASAFQGCTSLAAVTLGNGLTETGVSAFAGCTNLASVSLGLNVTAISGNSFEGCTSLTSFAIPGNVTFLGASAFAGCTSLASVTIPGSVAVMDPYVFQNCTGLTSVSLSRSVTTIGYGAFKGCTSLATLSIPGVTRIEDSAFQDCTGLASITIPDNVFEIGWHSFHGCSGLTSITIGSGLNYIEPFALNGCTALEQIEVNSLNQSFTSVDGVLFDKSRSTLIKYPAKKAGPYTIPDSVVKVGGIGGAFEGCTGLTSLSIPASVTQLDIYGATGLTEFTVAAANQAYSSLAGVLFNKNRTTLVSYPQGMAGDSYAVPAGVTNIAAQAFEDCTALASVAFPGSVTTIGVQAFEDCTGLTTVSFPDSVTQILSGSFQRCTGLTSVAIGRGVTEIGVDAFSGCSSLTGFTVDALNGTYGSIESVLFSRNPFNLLQVPAQKTGHYSIPNGVTGIFNADPFEGCSALTSVFIPASVTNHNGVTLFRGCLNLTAINVDLQNQHYSSLDGVLYDKIGITLMRYPPGRNGNCTVAARVTGIEQYAFEGCTGLDSILFLGDSRSVNSNPIYFVAPAPGCTVYYFRGSLGFTSPMWNGCPSVMIDRAVHPAAEWLLNYGLAYNANLQDDPNGDGVSLLFAYALNLNPNLNLRFSLPKPLLDADALSLSFYGVSPGITYIAETSTNLMQWTTDGVILSAPGADGRRTAAVARDDPMRFLRLRVGD
jgi:hypothetical protein